MGHVDVELALIEDYLADLGWCGTSTPANLQELLQGDGSTPGQPVLRIRRVGGPSIRDTNEDRPTVTIQVFALRDTDHPRAAHDVTEDVRDRMDALAGYTVPGQGLLDSAECTSGPVELPWPDPAVAVVQTVYGLVTRGIYIP